MRHDVSGDHPLRAYFVDAVHDSLNHRLGMRDSEAVESYLAEMLVRFLHLDAIYGVRDAAGRPVTEVAEMVAEGDVRLRANSFAREREVHRQIGDFLLFWSGLFPEYLERLRKSGAKDALLDPIGQGRMSYYVASTFDHDPYGEEAAIFRRLSDDFEDYRYGLSLVRASFDGFRRQGWRDGFEA